MTETTITALPNARAFSNLLANCKFWLAAIAIVTFCFYVAKPLGPDVSWLTTVSERILMGQTLYVDILEPNPPVAGYLYMPPVWLGQLLGIAPEPLIIIYTILAALLSTGVTTHLARKHGLLKRPDVFWPIAFLLVGCTWGDDFGQREHFVTMAALPLFAAIALRADGLKPATWHWILAGLCGGFILAVKPHFATAILLPVLYAAVRRRSLRPVFSAPELWLAGTTFLAFLAMIWFLFPAFITNIMAVATPTYVADRRDPLVLLGLLIIQFYLGFLVVSAIGYWRTIAANPFLGTVFFGSVGFFVTYFAQSRGYLYQLMPALMLLGVFFVISFAEKAEGQRKSIETAMAALCAIVLGAVPILNEIGSWATRDRFYDTVAAYGPGLNIVNILPDLTAGSPLHRVIDGTLVNSPPGLLMTLSAKRLRQEREISPEWSAALDVVEQTERDQLREDMQRQVPDIIVTAGSDYDWYAWAQEDPEIARMVADYEDFAIVPFFGYDLRLLKRPGLQPVQ